MRKGRFSDSAAQVAQRYSESVSFDWRLYRHDIAGSIAHAAALAQAGIITAEERDKIDNGLRAIEKEIEAGRFRRELYFRINGVTLRLPPLRERKEDIPALLEYFLAKHSRELKKDSPELSSSAREQLVSYDWPGNIRELENVARKIVAVGDSMLALSDLRAIPATVPMTVESVRISSLKAAARAASRRAERELILKALEQTHWNRKRAAQELRISYKSLLYKIKQIEVETPASQEL